MILTQLIKKIQTHFYEKKDNKKKKPLINYICTY